MRLRGLAIMLIALAGAGADRAAAQARVTKAECDRSARMPGQDPAAPPLAFYCFGVREKQLDTLRACAAQKADFNQVCYLLDRPLALAAGAGSEPRLRILLEGGANPKHVNSVGWSALYSVVNACGLKNVGYDECLASLRLLKDAGVDINKTDPYGTSPLWWSLNTGDERLTEDLILMGADVNQSRRWVTPLDYAVEMRMTRVIPVLEKHGAQRASGFALMMQRINKGIDSMTRFPMPGH